MGLHYISEDGQTLHFHCQNAECRYHNCAAWEHWLQCASCDEVEHVVIPAEEMKQVMLGKVSDEELAQVGDTVVTRVSQENRQQGETRQVPIDHAEIEWTGPDMVGLPTCECGTRLFLKVHFTEKELNNPVNMRVPVRDPQNPSVITDFWIHPMPARHMALAETLKASGKVYTPPSQVAPVQFLTQPYTLPQPAALEPPIIQNS